MLIKLLPDKLIDGGVGKYEMSPKVWANVLSFYRLFAQTKKKVGTFHGMAAASDILNFFRSNIKGEPDSTKLVIYPMVVNEKVYFYMPYGGKFPASVKASKIVTPGVRWKKLKQGTHMVKYYINMKKISHDIGQMEKDGFTIVNKKELLKEVNNATNAKAKVDTYRKQLLKEAENFDF